MQANFSGQSCLSETYLSFLSSNRQSLGRQAEKCQKNEKKRETAIFAGWSLWTTAKADEFTFRTTNGYYPVNSAAAASIPRGTLKAENLPIFTAKCGRETKTARRSSKTLTRMSRVC
jgi:hypothetical protein